jgi:hypothetical protein
VPYGTDCRFDPYQAINCLATIISPSGTQTGSPVHIRGSTSVAEGRSALRARRLLLGIPRQIQKKLRCGPNRNCGS